MRLIFGGIIAVILLGLYSYAVYEAVMLAQVATPGPLPPGFVLVLQTVGGLISALVIAELAVTQPGAPPVARALAPAGGGDPGATATRVVTIVAWIYVLAWIVLGLVAFVVGTLNEPGKVQSLTDLGQAWLGLAVAAAYAYFGIDPS